jgi:hypothetical protein
MRTEKVGKLVQKLWKHIDFVVCEKKLPSCYFYSRKSVIPGNSNICLDEEQHVAKTSFRSI